MKQGTRRDFLRALSLGAGALAGARIQAAAPAKPGRPPNVILVMTDDQGYGDLGCHGNKIIRTPHLDKLHAQSVRLTDFHVAPVCTPTRAQLMTGRDAVRVGAWATTWGRSLPRRDETMMAEVFRKGGYRTGMFGKWHLGDNYPYRPEDRGFEDVLRHGGGGVGQAPDHWGNNYFDDTYCHNGQWKPHKGYCTDVWFDAALAFIKTHRDRPFFAYLSTNAPHGPYLVAKRYKQMYAGKKGVPHAAFYGMITNIDENMGRLMGKLDEWGLADNTILIFLTDNGTSAGVGRGGAGHNAGMRGRKGSFYDGGHRVPCFVRWGGKLGAPRDVATLTCCQDLLPTLAALCGLTLPAGQTLDGRDISPLLKSSEANWPDRTLVVQYSQSTTPPPQGRAAVLTQRWRLVGGRELYDIQVDPGQKTNLAARHPDVVKKLRAQYARWWKDVSRRFGELSHIVIGSDRENPVRLSSFDWHGVRQVPWSQGAVRAGVRVSGFWAVEAGRGGEYDITLRRWPAGATPIAKAAPGGKAVPAAKARIKIGSAEQTKAIGPEAATVTFTVAIPKGKTRLQTWLLDQAGKELCGAFYVDVAHR